MFARVLGVAFSFILAGNFIPKDFGTVQYAIVMSNLLAFGTIPFGQHVVARYIGRNISDQNNLNRIYSHVLVLWILVFVLSAAVGIPILLLLGKFDFGVLVIFVGTSFFYAYWGLSSGFLSSKKLVTAYLGSNVMQLLLVILFIQLLNIKSPLLAAIIYGTSYFLPLILLHFFAPHPVNVSFQKIEKNTIFEILRFSLPIWISHGCYLIYNSIGVVALEHYFDKSEVGIYSVANTISMAFFLIPNGISTLFMPKSASISRQEGSRMLLKMLAASLIINMVLLLGLVIYGDRMILAFFGSDYLVGKNVYIIQAAAMILFGMHTVITAFLVGRGKPNLETISRIGSVIISLIFAVIYIPKLGPLGASMTRFAGALMSLIVYGVLALAIGTDTNYRIILKKILRYNS